MSAHHLLIRSLSSTSATRYALKVLLVASILAGFTTACATIAQSVSNDPATGEKAAQQSKLDAQVKSIDSLQPVLKPGHDYGGIYGAVDPGIYRRDHPQPPFIYKVNGQTVVRRSELGPLTDPVENSIPVFPVRGPGRDYGTIYDNIDPGTIRLDHPQPPIVHWFNGQMVPRRSELGPLTDPVENYIPVFPARGPGRDYGAIYGTVDPGLNQSIDPAIISVPTHGPGHNFGAIYGDVDPGANPSVDLPIDLYKFSYAYNFYMPQ
jgi:hypothetical protein